MARKITIRRVGGFLPAISLVALILLASTFIWLSTAGLPGFVLRSIEAEAARDGIYLHIGKLRLSPSAGLALRAHDLRLYAAQGDAEPLARVGKATLGISVMALLQGSISPHMAQVHGAELTLPCSQAGEALRLTGGNFAATIHNNSLVRLTSASMELSGITLHLRGSYRFAEKKSSGEGKGGKSRPLDIAAELAPYQESIDDIHRIISRQEWTGGNAPHIDLNISNERGLQLAAQINAPRFDHRQFHVRGAQLDLAYQQNTIIINDLRFNTIEPDSTVSMQGGYDIDRRRLSFSLESSAALARMAEALDIPGANEWLTRYRHKDNSPPVITLRGDLSLEEDFSPKSITLRGRLHQGRFRYGSTQVEKMGLSFFYKDGDFNLDELALDFPQGSLGISASASGRQGTGRARIKADMEVGQLLHVISEFTGEEVKLPEGLELAGRLRFETDARLSMPAFQAGQTDWRHYVPSLQSIEMKLAADRAGYRDYRLEKTDIKLHMQGISHDRDLIPDAVQKATLAISAASASLPQGEEASPLRLSDARLDLSLTDLAANAQDVSLEHAEGSLRLGSLSMKELSTGEIDLQIEQLEHLRPLEGNWRSMLQKGSLALRANALRSNDTLLGSLDSSVSLDEAGHIALKAGLEREGSRMELDLHPRLQEDGLLVLEGVDLTLPAAGFEPLLGLAGIDLPHIRLPETLSLSGSASIDTESGQLREAKATLGIPHLVRTPGTGSKALHGKEIPLALAATLEAEGREDGEVDMQGDITLTHKAGSLAKPDNRRMELHYKADTTGLIQLSGTCGIDVNTLDALIDDKYAHRIMRDFRCGNSTHTDVRIHSVTIDCREGLDVQADCTLTMDNFGFQLSAVEDVLDARKRPTGKEKLRSDLGPDPFATIRRLKGKVHVHHREDCRDEAGRPLGNKSSVTIEDADISYDNRPWLRRKKLKGGTAESRLLGKKVVIDIEEGFVEIFDVEGKVYPDYAFGIFYDDLYSFLDIFTLPRPASVESAHCLFPIYRDSKRDMEGCIRMMARKADLHFLGTTFPLQNFSGFIWLREGSVYLDRLNAACWDGALNAAVNIDYSGDRTGFDGYAELSNVNLRPLAGSYGSKQADALCNGQIRFRTPTPDIEDLEAYGEVHIVNGDLMSLSLFRPVGELITNLPGYLTELEKEASSSKGEKPGWISRQAGALFSMTGKLVDNVGEGIGSATNNIPFANHFLRYDLQEAHGHFIIDLGWLRTRQFHALGYNLDVSMRVAINLDSLEIKGNIWPQISSVPTIILSPLTFLSRYVVDINVYGTVEDLQWRFGLDKRLQNEDAPASSATDKPSANKLKPRR